MAELAAALESLPAGSHVSVHIEQLSYIDHACLDLIGQWRKQHVARTGQACVPWDDLQLRYQECENRTQVANGAVAEAQSVNGHHAQAPISVVKLLGTKTRFAAGWN